MEYRIRTRRVKYIAGRYKDIYALEQLGRDGYWYEIGRYGYLEQAERRKQELESKTKSNCNGTDKEMHDVR